MSGYAQHYDLVPTLLELAGIETDIVFDGASLVPMMRDEVVSHRSEFYITECTWMRKHGWRTPEWKLIVALEPDFHFKPTSSSTTWSRILASSTTWLRLSLESSTFCGAGWSVGSLDVKLRPACPIPSTTRATGTVTRGGCVQDLTAGLRHLHIGNPQQAARLQAGNKDEDEAAE